MVFRKEKIEGRFLKIAREHEQVLNYTEKIKQFLEKDNAADQIKNILPEFKSDMKHHFDVEERFLFPAALLCLPSIELVDIIMVLQKEHGFFERDLETLDTMLGTNTENRLNKSISGFLKTMIKNIEKHAQTEMDDLFPKMDANRKCRKIIKGILLED